MKIESIRGRTAIFLDFKNDPVVSVTDSTNTPAVHGESGALHGNGVLGVTTADGHAGVAGVCDTSNGNGSMIEAKGVIKSPSLFKEVPI